MNARSLCRGLLSVLGASALLAAGPLRAEPSPDITAELVCPSSTPGRVVCKLALRSPAQRLVWADVLVTKTPSFAKPLRARIGFPERTEHTEQSAVIPLALVAIGAGEGVVEATGRAVLCDAKRRGACVARTLRVSAVVRVESREAR